LFTPIATILSASCLIFLFLALEQIHPSNIIMTDTDVKPAADEVHDVKLTPLLLAKYVLSVGMLIFSITLVGALMFTGNTRVSAATNPWVCLIVCVSTVCLNYSCKMGCAN
jgi:hypothetical protein